MREIALVRVTFIWICCYCELVKALNDYMNYDEQQRNKVCAELRSGDQQIVCIGVLGFSGNLLLVTSRLSVLQLPARALDQSDHRLYLYGHVPLITTRWPLLQTVLKAESTGLIMATLNEASDSNQHYIVWSNGTEVFAYSILNDTLFKATFVNMIQNVMGTVSTTEPMLFYSVNPMENVRNENITKSSKLALYENRFVGSSNLSQSTSLQVKQPRYLCIQDKKAFFSIEMCPIDVSTFHSGFTNAQHYYLFMDRSVYIFDHIAMQTLGQRVKLEQILLEDFLVCAPVYESPFDAFMKWIIVLWFNNLIATFAILFGLFFYVHYFEKLMIQYLSKTFQTSNFKVDSSSIMHQSTSANVHDSKLKKSILKDSKNKKAHKNMHILFDKVGSRKL